MDIDRYLALYRDKLLDDVLPFWLTHSLDRECGGYFTCLERDGTVFDTDKFMWLQGRGVWTMATMYHKVRQEPGWLEAAKLGAEFIRDHGFDENGRVYFALDHTGGPIEVPNSIFSDFFCAMGLAAYGKAANQSWATRLAGKMADQIQQWMVHRRSDWDTSIPDARPANAVVHEMINVNFCQEMDELLGDDKWAQTGIESAERIVRLHIDPREELVFESAAPDGSHPDTFAGRLILPGHALEVMWFVIEAGRRWNRPDITKAAVAAVEPMLDFGWDDEYGGLFYFMDARGKPPQQLECDLKLWWVHFEALVAVLMAWRQTGGEQYAGWFERLHEYTWKHFDDPEYGEFFGYLSREGKPYWKLKGGKWKGCFHVPRALWMCWRMLEELKGR